MKNTTSTRTPRKSTLNDVNTRQTVSEAANSAPYWELEQDYIPQRETQWPMRIGYHEMRCLHYSGLLPEENGISRSSGMEYHLPPRYEFEFVDVKTNERVSYTLYADDVNVLNRWKQNADKRCGGKIWEKFNSTVSPDAKAPIYVFSMNSFAHYLNENVFEIKYDFKEWVDKTTNEFRRTSKPVLWWYDENKDSKKKTWGVF